MKKSILFIIALGFALAPVPMLQQQVQAQSSTCYIYFEDGYDNVRITACEYDSGTSGFYKIENLVNVDIKVCWTLEARDGSTQRGCKSRLDAFDEESSSCTICNRNRTGGIVDVEWRTLQEARR